VINRLLLFTGALAGAPSFSVSDTCNEYVPKIAFSIIRRAARTDHALYRFLTYEFDSRRVPPEWDLMLGPYIREYLTRPEKPDEIKYNGILTTFTYSYIQFVYIWISFRYPSIRFSKNWGGGFDPQMPPVKTLLYPGFASKLGVC